MGGRSKGPSGCQQSYGIVVISPRRGGLLPVQVKSSQQHVVGLRDRVTIIRALLHAISSPQPYAGYGDLIGVGRRSKVSPLIQVPVPGSKVK